MEQSASNTVQQGLTTQSLLPEDQVERKTESMIPLFASIAQRQQEKIDRLNEKISTIESKIERNKTAIDRLQHKSAILRKDADLMRKIAKKLPAFSSALNAMADKKLQKIDKIEKQKIPVRLEKIRTHEQKIDNHRRSLAKAEKKISRATHVSDFLKNFGNMDKEARRAGYLSGLAALTNDAQERTERKIIKLTSKLEQAEPHLNSVQHQNVLRAKIKQLEQKKDRLIDTQKLLKGIDQNRQNVILLPMLDRAIERGANAIPEMQSIQLPHEASKAPEMPSIQVNKMLDAVVKVNSKILAEEIPSMPTLETSVQVNADKEQPSKVFSMSRKAMTQNADQLHRDTTQHDAPSKTKEKAAEL